MTTTNSDAGSAMSDGNQVTGISPSQLTLLRHGLIVLGLFGGAALTGIAAGALIGDFLRANPDATLPWLGVKVSLASGAVAISTVIALLKETLQVLGTLPGHLENPTSRPAFLDMLKLFFAFLAFIVATKVVQLEKEAIEVRVSSPFEFTAHAPVIAPDPIAAFPLLFELNGAKQGEDWTQGIELDDTRLQSILEAVKPCIDASVQPAAPTVTLEVVGYASSKEFANEEPEESERLNVELANRRTAVTFAALDRLISQGALAGGIRVERAPNWRTFEEMVSARPVLDRFKDAKREELENWTRRADIKVIRGGRCTRMNILRNVGIVRTA